jgi:tetratricopeptide (TPR) repeat protein
MANYKVNGRIMMQRAKAGLLFVLLAILVIPQLAWGIDKVKEANEKAAQNYYEYAMMMGTDGKDQEAIKALDQAIGIKPDFVEAYSMKGSSLERLGRFREAEEAFRQAIKIKPSYAEGYYYLGNFLINRGKTQEGEDALKKAKQLQR